MSSTTTPLERLAEFPNMMNWRGTWLVTEQYLKNDVVVSPSNGSSYILTETSLLNGTDPSINAEWAELAPAATGVTQINAGAGITVTNPTGPIVSVANNGVISLIQGTNIAINNTDPNNPVINSTALSGVSQGLGIGISGLSFSPTITNTGVRTLAVGTGLVSNLDPNNPSIGTTAVLTISQGNGILVTGGQTATITNDGVISVGSSGIGISVDNTDPRNPIVTNTGVVSVIAGSNITVSVGSNPVLSALVPQITLVNGTVAGPLPLTWPVSPSQIGSFVLDVTQTDIFFTYIKNGAPDVNGTFLLDLSSINIFATGSTPVAAGDKITLLIRDDITTAPTDISVQIGEIIMNSVSNSYPFQIRPSQYAINVANVRSTGFREPIYLDFFNATTNSILEINSWGSYYATYYPNGLV